MTDTLLALLDKPDIWGKEASCDHCRGRTTVTSHATIMTRVPFIAPGARPDLLVLLLVKVTEIWSTSKQKANLMVPVLGVAVLHTHSNFCLAQPGVGEARYIFDEVTCQKPARSRTLMGRQASFHGGANRGK